jgi:hypothetical protein
VDGLVSNPALQSLSALSLLYETLTHSLPNLSSGPYLTRREPC